MLNSVNDSIYKKKKKIATTHTERHNSSFNILQMVHHTHTVAVPVATDQTKKSRETRQLEDDVAFWGKPLSLQTQSQRYPVVLLFCVFILAIALNITTDRMPDPAQERPLPDMGQELIPKMTSLEHITDLFLGLLNGALLLLVWKLYLLHRRAKQLPELYPQLRFPVLSWITHDVWCGFEDLDRLPYDPVDCFHMAWIRFWVTYSILSLFRAPVIMLTSMPATDNHCQQPPKILHPLENIILTIVTLGSGSIHCGDLMFSGHSLSATLAFITLFTYGPMVWWILRPLGATFMSLTWITILASRSHYTDDIVVAIYLTVATYWLIPHNPKLGAPLSLQTVIRWWPCCCKPLRTVLREEADVESEIYDTPPLDGTSVAFMEEGGASPSTSTSAAVSVAQSSDDLTANK